MKSLEELTQGRSWDGLGPRHQQMVRRITELTDSREVVLDDASWETWQEELVAAADRVRDGHAPVSDLEEVVESGYRRVMFSASPDIKRLLELGPDTTLVPRDADDIEALRTQA